MTRADIFVLPMIEDNPERPMYFSRSAGSYGRELGLEALVSLDDARIQQEHIEYPSPKGYGTMRGYMARPSGATGRRPGVLVIHENRGLNPHIEDITRRLAVDGFLAFAPDALFPLGGDPGDEEKAREVFPKLEQAKTREDFIAGSHFLKARPECTGNIGAVGFCYGGGMVNFLATQLGSDLSAGVAFMVRRQI